MSPTKLETRVWVKAILEIAESGRISIAVEELKLLYVALKDTE